MQTKTTSPAGARTQNITGNTYPVKDKLKAIGCRWNGADKCWMATGDKMISEAKAIVSGQPARNNPIAVPPDLGPVDVAAECAKHGRTPTGNVAVPFRRDSQKGEATTVGETFWGKDRGVRSRYLIIRDARPYYLSATTLEDNDDFQSQAGWYRSVEAVAVEPTAEEIATDPTKLKAEKESSEKLAKETAATERAARLAANMPRLLEIAAIVAQSEELGGAGGCQYLFGGYGQPSLLGSHGFLIYTSVATDRPGPIYPDGSGGRPLGRILRDAALAAEAFRLAETRVSYMD